MHFDSVVLVSATQVALRRTDVHAERVAKFPEPAIYRLKFEGGTLYPTVKNREVSTRSGRIFNGRQ